jgi:nucleotide-binding universal stress UspA family protein
MTQVLLVGTDCSDCSNRTLDKAAHWAKLSGLPLTVVHVIEWSPYSFNTPQENAQRHKRREEELERAHTQIIDPILQRLRAEGIEAEGIIRHGHPAETLNEVARELDAAHIIVGRTGQSAIKTKLFGSVAITLVQIADRPVTVVP